MFSKLLPRGLDAAALQVFHAAWVLRRRAFHSIAGASTHPAPQRFSRSLVSSRPACAFSQKCGRQHAAPQRRASGSCCVCARRLTLLRPGRTAWPSPGSARHQAALFEIVTDRDLKSHTKHTTQHLRRGGGRRQSHTATKCIRQPFVFPLCCGLLRVATCDKNVRRWNPSVKTRTCLTHTQWTRKIPLRLSYVCDGARALRCNPLVSSYPCNRTWCALCDARARPGAMPCQWTHSNPLAPVCPALFVAYSSAPPNAALVSILIYDIRIMPVGAAQGPPP